MVQVSSVVYFKKLLIFFVVIVLGIVYFLINPQNYNIFPKCPVYYFTGLKCPGCGSQRAVHHLLHLDFVSALKENFLLVIAIPYLVTGFVFEQIKQPSERILKWRKILYGKIAIIFVLVIIVLFCVCRNLFSF
jgi:hypothetical protein